MKWNPRSLSWLISVLLCCYGLLAVGLAVIPADWLTASSLPAGLKAVIDWLLKNQASGWIQLTAGCLAWAAAATLWMPSKSSRPGWMLPTFTAFVAVVTIPLLLPGVGSDGTAAWVRVFWPHEPMNWPIILVLVWLCTFVVLLKWPKPLISWLSMVVSYVLMAASALGVSSNFLKLDLIYNQPRLAAVNVALSVILFVCGLILLLRRQALLSANQPGISREDSLISSIGLGLLVTIAFTTGLASFITLQSQVESSLYASQVQLMDNRIMVFYNAMDAAYNDTAGVKRDAVLAKMLEDIDKPGVKLTDEMREKLLDQAATDLPFKVGAYELRSSSGQVLARRGEFKKSETIWLNYRDRTEVRLEWFENVPFVGMTIRINDADQAKIGELAVELPAADWEQLASDTYDLGRTGVMLACGTNAEVLRCIQSRSQKGLYIPPENGPLTTMIQDALEGERSLPTTPKMTKTESGKTVVATYGPIGKVQIAIKAPGIGLAMLILTDAVEFYEPVRHQLQKILPLLLGIIVFGGVILRRLVVPLIRALRDKEARFRELTELSSDCYWQMDNQLVFVEITGATLLDSGVQVEKWLGHSIGSVPALVETNSHENGLAELERQLIEREPFYEVTFRIAQTDDSGVHFLSLSGAPLFDEKGVFIGYRGVGKNITPRKLAEEALREAQQGLEARVAERTAELSTSNSALAVEVEERTQAEARFRSLTELSSDWYWEMNRDFRFVQISGEVDRKGGFSASESLGKAIWEQDWVVPDEDNWAGLRNALESGDYFYDYTIKILNFKQEVRYLAISGQPFYDKAQLLAGFRGTGKDITDKRLAEDHIHFLAHYDSLTKLPNRAFLTEQVHFAIDRAKRHQTKLALVFIDLDRFKIINDSLGHDAGDEVLRIVAERLVECVRDTDMVSRLGGDEFVVLLEDITDANHAGITARRILNRINDPFELMGEPYTVGASIGVSLYPDDGDSIADLLKHSDTAMYLAKKDGRNGIYFFSNVINDNSMALFRLESDLRQALEQEQFILHYQPKVNPATLEIVGVEALIRWFHPTRGMVSPLEFIPMAEECGLIVPIGEWVINKALSQLVIWDEAKLPTLKMSVNLSPRQLHENLPDVLANALQKHGVAPHRLELELTESTMLQRPERDISLLVGIRSTGVRIALDDFGTGYSSLSSLASLPLDCIKIDRSFVERLPADIVSIAIARSILTMARGIGLEIVAEGVETVEQWNWLSQEGCHQIQGYYFSKPLAPEQAHNFIVATEARRLALEAEE